VIAGFGEQPILLVTNLKLRARDSESVCWAARIYGTRWKIEETFRFVKQSYNLEDIRGMKYRRLKNLVVLVTAAAYFAATYLGQQMKLRIPAEKLLVISPRFFGIPPFRSYALADGMRRLLSAAHSSLRRILARPATRTRPHRATRRLLGKVLVNRKRFIHVPISGAESLP